MKPDIIVVGASAGGVEALGVLAAGLPKDLKAAVFVVLHIGRGINGHSMLPAILNNAGPLPACHPSDDEAIRHRRIYVAVPDQHMVIAPGHVHSVHGPKENLTRPAINPLFRSAAAAYDGRVVGVLLSGMLDDGVAGLAQIKRRGGIAVVQDPADARYPDMPRAALKKIKADHVAAIKDIAHLLAELVKMERQATITEETMERKLLEITCPECEGPVWEERQGNIVEFRCRVGHAYSPLALVDEQRQNAERKLWETVIALEAAAETAEQLGSELGPDAAEIARTKREEAKALRAMLKRAEPETQPETD